MRNSSRTRFLAAGGLLLAALLAGSFARRGAYRGVPTPSAGPPPAIAGVSPNPGFPPTVPFVPTRPPVPPQPVPFPHVSMVSRGVTCLFCHSGATKSPVAGIPSVYLCMGCHLVIGTDSPPIQRVQAYWEAQQPIPWVRIYRLPGFVQFSHRPHLAAGLNCEGCHGDVGRMEVTVPYPAYKQMGWCLECHEHQANPLPLTECQICHY
ncbi:MAG TPA: cytochrome c3 family protein [Anaerolineae bacterium]|nr:cytochrome c3 family protein [Anaerolineae bacterium]HOR00451.1 cytochrome c3 family protein [Anaerolineae bacterium]HPL27020.1 cytochrome c3 family protein [Anaerolineae bacterium]HPL27029.1 cytochrome c3 family protein [Anaerolineae bacterium]